MTLTEYLNQENPVRMPDVILQAGEYEVFGGGLHNFDNIHVFEYPQYSYLVSKSTGAVWSKDETNGMIKNKTCFRILI